MRLHVFKMHGQDAKISGSGKRSEYFEIAGLKIKVGSKEHENLIKEAIKQKILQNEKAYEALKSSNVVITHKTPGHSKPIFKIEKMLMSIRKELFGY